MIQKSAQKKNPAQDVKVTIPKNVLLVVYVSTRLGKWYGKMVPWKSARGYSSGIEVRILVAGSDPTWREELIIHHNSARSGQQSNLLKMHCVPSL